MVTIDVPTLLPMLRMKLMMPGDAVVLLRRNSDIGRQRDRHEQKSQAEHLRDAQPRGGTEADLQIDPLGGIDTSRSTRHSQPKRDEAARLDLRGQLAHDRHFNQQDHAARRKAQARPIAPCIPSASAETAASSPGC